MVKEYACDNLKQNCQFFFSLLTKKGLRKILLHFLSFTIESDAFSYNYWNLLKNKKCLNGIMSSERKVKDKKSKNSSKSWGRIMKKYWYWLTERLEMVYFESVQCFFR